MTDIDRWRPVRAGIVNLYEYADQELRFAGGRLLLRGHNTSGKTKALELLFPFVLDGDISPRKLDPFAAGAKKMAWNLVGCVDHEKRVGYVWLELERLGGERLTIGIGLRGNKGSDDVKRWHFICRGRRVGVDLQLVRDNGEPLPRAELVAALGDDGEVLDHQADYRRRLNELVFGFAQPDGYRTMLRLMLELRRPHLSKTLDPASVAELLSAGLPEIDEQLMRKLAAGLEHLDTLERGLARLRAVSERLAGFHERTYRAYLTAVALERAASVRRASSAVDAAAEALRESRELQAAAAAATELQKARRMDAEAAIVRLEGEERALTASAEWRSVAEVDALGARARAQAATADAREQAAEEAAARAASLEAEAIAARAAVDSARAELEELLDDVAACAARAGLERRAAVLIEQLRGEALEPAAWQELAGELARDWRAVLAAHAALVTAVIEASGRLARARDAERVAQDRLHGVRSRRAAIEDELAAARDGVAHAIDEWAEALSELAPEPGELEAARAAAADGRDGSGALGPAADRARRERYGERGGIELERERVLERLADVRGRIDALESERDEGPAPPGWTRTEREGRAGAPMWRLVDFASEVPDEDRARIEAALEAAGLLDAWVAPDGRLLDADVLDAALVAGPVASATTLADVLEPVGAAVAGAPPPVDPSIVRGVLTRVALRSTAGAAESDAAAVGRDGTFRLGPLAGRARKDAAEHIGAAAREARRTRLLAALNTEAAALDEGASELADARQAIEVRIAAIDGELARWPDAAAVAAALLALDRIVALEHEAVAAHEHARADALNAADARAHADAMRSEHAAEHDLPSVLDVSALTARRVAAAELAGATGGVARAADAARQLRDGASQLERRRDEEHALAADRARLAQAEREAADRLAAEHAERSATLGAAAAELRARYDRTVAVLAEVRAQRVDADAAERAAGFEAVRLEHEAAARERRHELAREERAQAAASLGRLLATDAPALIGLEQTEPEGLTVTRALELSRALPDQVRAVRTAPGALAQQVTRAAQQLDRELTESDMGAYTATDDDGLVLVRVTDGPGVRPLGAVLDALTVELAERERVLSAEERRVFGDALVEELADHLRQRIHAVRERVAQMNAVLRRSPTAAGKVVQLDWRAVDDDAGGQRRVCDLLRKDVRYHDEQERREVVDFFRRRTVDARRERSSAGTDAAPLAAILATAFDYRRWFAFGLVEEVGGRRQPLTRQRHAVGSGGEQSVLIHLPLFAAAAALYGDSAAPRLVMLDEALSGIDDATRERVLAATVAFDLDLVMTSHELWGTYRSVPSLAIYQLHREQGAFGVHAIPFVWDGEVLRELEQGELIV